jgi:hypothetical protein
MSQCVIFVFLGILLMTLTVPVIGEETNTENLSAARTLGVGMQVGFPWIGLISGRYWGTENLGLEDILLIWGNPGELSGSLTGRALSRLSDTPTVDFYLAGGITYSFSGFTNSQGESNLVSRLPRALPGTWSSASRLRLGASSAWPGESEFTFTSKIQK